MRINLLATLDRNYLTQLKVMLTSLYMNTPEDSFSFFILHSNLSDEDLDEISRWCVKRGWSFFSIAVDDTLFRDAPVSSQSPREMYYRLLAPYLLPHTIERIIYLDPDTLVINPIRKLWEMDLGDCIFAAAAHTGVTEIANGVNRIRLKTESDYYNSGVLLFDLESGRKDIIPEDIFAFVRKHEKELLLPDQDLLNMMYWKQILPLDDSIWNYDARNYSSYFIRSAGLCSTDWVMKNTSVLHFCGKAKPWKPGYIYRFGILYKHYMQLAERSWEFCR